MPEKINKNDFVEIDYIARIKDTSQIFDLTNEETAKKENIYNPEIKYKPIIICIGQHDVIQGLENEMIDKEIGKEYKIDLKAENAFGLKDTKLMKLIPSNVFRQQKIIPAPGLQVQVNGLFGVIKTFSSGRCIVDFNHPLAGKDISYEIKILRVIKDDKEKLKSILELFFKEPEFEIKDSIAEIKIEIPEPVQKQLIEKIKTTIPAIKEVKFIKKQAKESKKSISTAE